MKLGSTIVLEKTAGGLNSGALGKFLAKTLKVAGLRGAVSVLITSDTKIRNLNSTFRRKNSTTDVLSFPAAAANGFVGDIAISVDIARKNARALGHSLNDEVRILILHGILHLAGYDHENDRGEMEQKETELRKRLGLPTGLIERSSRNSTFGVGRSSFGKSLQSKRRSQRTRTKDQRLSRT